MSLLTNQKMELISLAQEASEKCILPRFRALDEEQVDTKAHESDLVTIADTDCEEYLTNHLEATFPGCFVLGEEAVAADKTLLDKLPEAELAFILDPIDGTWNFANDHPVFGTIIAVVEKGIPTFGMHYDPISRQATFALKGEGAWSSYNGHLKRISVAQAKPVNKMTGFLPYYIFRYRHGEEVARKVCDTMMDFDRTMSLRCSAHEYRMLAEGSVDFSLTSNVQPWDHVAGMLIHSEAGGYNGLLDGRAYDTSIKEGHLLMANDKATWDMLQAKFSFLND